MINPYFGSRCSEWRTGFLPFCRKHIFKYIFLQWRTIFVMSPLLFHYRRYTRWLQQTGMLHNIPVATINLYRADSSNITDDDSEFDWYTPVAVILKPATQKELKKRLQEDDASRYSSFPQYHHPFSPPLPREYDPWENNP